MSNPVRVARCKHCQAEMLWLRPELEKWLPVNYTAESYQAVERGMRWYRALGAHWETCPRREEVKRQHPNPNSPPVKPVDDDLPF